MIRKIVDAWLIELKLLTRSILFWLILILLFIPSLVILCTRHLPINPADALTSTAPIIQAGIFISIILGFHLMKQEEKSFSDEVFITLPLGYFVKSLGKLFAIITLVIGSVMISLLVLYIIYYFYSIPGVFYLKTIPYLILYFGLPFLISGFIGLGVGSFTHSKVVYIGFVVLWLFLGPLNIGLLKPLMALLKQDLTDALIFLNLGQTDPHEIFDPVYGFQLETKRWIIKGIMLVVVLTLVILIILNRSYLRNLKIKTSILISSFSILSLLIYEYQQPSQIVTSYYGKGSVLRYDSNYYRDHPDINFKNDSKLIPLSYNIELNESRVLSAKVGLVLTSRSKSKEFIFSLYHRLKVKNIQLNGGKVQFEQKGDQIKVKSHEFIGTGEKVKLVFDYEGQSSPFYFANEQSIMLPSFFMWYPIPSSYQAMLVNDGDLKQNIINFDHDVNFELKYNGKLNINTNLTQKGKGYWAGHNQDGPTIIAGMMNNIENDKSGILYPKSMTLIKKEFPYYLNELKTVIRQVNRDLDLKLSINKPFVFFVSTPNWSGRTPSNLLLLKEQMFVSIGQNFNGTGILTNKPIMLPSVLQSIFNDKNYILQNEDAKYFFVSSYTYWFNTNNPIFKEGEALPLKYNIDVYKNDPTLKKETKILENLLDFIEKNKDNKTLLRSFFRDWLKQLKQTKNMTFNDIQDLIITYQQRVNSHG